MKDYAAVDEALMLAMKASAKESNQAFKDCGLFGHYGMPDHNGELPPLTQGQVDVLTALECGEIMTKPDIDIAAGRTKDATRNILTALTRRHLARRTNGRGVVGQYQITPAGLEALKEWRANQ